MAAQPQSHHSLDHYENPFYLHNSDHAGLALVTDRLFSGAEFHAWRRSVRMVLNVQNKLGFIDGTTLKPSIDHRIFELGHDAMIWFGLSILFRKRSVKACCLCLLLRLFGRIL